MRVYNFKRCENWNNAVEYFETMMSENAKDFPTSVVVFVSHCDEVGIINSSDVHVFRDFVDASATINKYEYMKDIVVDVYATKRNELLNGVDVVHVKHKLYNGVCYSCLAGCSPDFWNDVRLATRTLSDKFSTVYIYGEGGC